MVSVKERINVELAPEVNAKIELSENKFVLINENELDDLRYVSISSKGYQLLKRIIDILVAISVLAVSLLPMAIIALVIYVDDPGKVFFTHYRVGRNGKRFKLYKFRTMKMDTPKYLPTMDIGEPDKYITRAGVFLRKMSLDELPQLFNVIKGEMSLVGPRPLISDEYEIHAMRMKFGVYSVRPGITGLAQVNGRDLVSSAEKVRWDIKYVENFGFWQDVKIILMTIPKVFGREGVVEGGTGELREE